MSEYDKDYYERYAQLTLYHVFPEWKSRFLRLDRPDLQNEYDGIGIEVTSSSPSKIREVESYGANLLGKEISSKVEEIFRGELLLSPERVAYAFSPTKGLVDSDRSPQIISAISHKRDIWDGYKAFRMRGIYVFTGTSLIDDGMLFKVEKSEAFSFFQIVFINAIDKLFFYENGWKRKEFSDEELVEFKSKALLKK